MPLVSEWLRTLYISGPATLPLPQDLFICFRRDWSGEIVRKEEKRKKGRPVWPIPNCPQGNKPAVHQSSEPSPGARPDQSQLSSRMHSHTNTHTNTQPLKVKAWFYLNAKRGWVWHSNINKGWRKDSWKGLWRAHITTSAAESLGFLCETKTVKQKKDSQDVEGFFYFIRKRDFVFDQWGSGTYAFQVKIWLGQ